MLPFADHGPRPVQRIAVPVSRISIIGCGFVADLYMRSVQATSGMSVVAVYDHDPERLRVFCAHWNLRPVATLEALLDATPQDGLVLNLTNPEAHYELTKSCLLAGHHVYSEKPLAMTLDQARDLHRIAGQKGVMLGSAPCSVLGEAAQTLGHALRSDICGTPRLIYAELDDGFVPQAAYRKWQSESGAPWPFQDEFDVGCTLEHAGYYLAWMISWFGPVKSVTAASAECLPDKTGTGPSAPDFATATLFFASGPVARLTCSILAPHDHSIRVIGDKGVLKVDQAWDNAAPVRFAKRLRLRRRLIEHPLPRRIRLPQPTHPKVKRWGAAAMNFMLGPAEMLDALAEGRPSRLSADFALHMTEVTLAISSAGDSAGAVRMTTTCERMEPMPWSR
ncbi:MAG: Gfo/Idh/MocA family oxidoreductase [Rhodobacteraceae bacterium]|nr:Gfo/Idh/MocA family oxidoreductase [Paracoccaceae bacterium]